MNRTRIDCLEQTGILPREELVALLRERTPSDAEYAANRAAAVSAQYYGNQIYVRGLIEFTNICKNDCYYCGIRKSNCNVMRYRLSEEEILACCKEGYRLGFRTFVLQGGEDAFFTDARLAGIIRHIKSEYPDCAVTLSVGERSPQSYQVLREAGADRYLLRHETAVASHYQALHPVSMSHENRIACIQELKQVGFQTGCGFMVGSPYQTWESLAEDLLFIHRIKPQMVGIGPFLPQKDTPFSEENLCAKKSEGEELGLAELSPREKTELTIFLLSIIRLMEKNILLPATTALATIDPEGRRRGVLAGANVVMPNLSPLSVRDAYALYDNKANRGDEAAEGRRKLEIDMKKIGYQVVTDVGHIADML